MVWYHFERYFESVKHFQTVYGSLWYANIFCFRLFCTTVIGEELFDDDQLEFVCDTHAPGCKQVCFNDFSPMSWIRFWAIQCVLNMFPLVVFQTYAIQQMSRDRDKKFVDYNDVLRKYDLEEESRKLEKNSSLLNSKKFRGENLLVINEIDDTAHLKLQPQNNQNQKQLRPSQVGAQISLLRERLSHLHKVRKLKKSRGQEVQQLSPGVVLRIMRFYLFHCLMKIALECAFLYVAFRIQVLSAKTDWDYYDEGFRKSWFRKFFYIPEKFACNHGRRHRDHPWLSPCHQHEVVACWVSRPREKQNFYQYMLVCQVASILTSICDILKILAKIVRLKIQTEKARRLLQKRERSVRQRGRIGVKLDENLFWR